MNTLITQMGKSVTVLWIRLTLPKTVECNFAPNLHMLDYL